MKWAFLLFFDVGNVRRGFQFPSTVQDMMSREMGYADGAPAE